MARTGLKSVEDYIASQPPAARGVLTRVRNSIRRALPGAEEMISYKIPAYKLHGVALLFFAGWKAHFSMYPASKELVAAFKSDLAPCEIRGHTIRFPLCEPVPGKLIERIAKFRAREVAGRKKRRAASPSH